MPYDSLNDLPDNVQNSLPKHGQEIFKEAFNSAEEQYDDEETPFQVAWSAVKEKYEKKEQGHWVRKEDD
ncbi:ChaB family protein [Evansella sp. LMS18]|uniref:ChaB family protein n=1 Tax=Evansella sp. LMS18 TaxID=2924033 RepID=UPI0020D07671|nr:ChaB family protein [Evansella sp. LMS18]UTR09853.1 ChaB family protein [Evansella sp. LMS18]